MHFCIKCKICVLYLCTFAGGFIGGAKNGYLCIIHNKIDQWKK